MMDRKRIERSLNRMAHQIREDNAKDKQLVLLGINERGFALAGMLQEILESLIHSEVQCHQLRLNEEQHDQVLPELDERYVLLVDDVIFSGTTLFKALKKVSGEELPGEVHTVVLIDRGHRKYPVNARFVGLDLPTKLDEHVSVEIEENRPVQVILHQSMY
jgi:pyrimidine operon attenuation protein/uracil phosphoribosyltransferase